MRKILLLLCFLVVTLSASAQIFSVGIGLRWGRGSSSGLASAHWQNGYYYDKAGRKVDGLFKNYLPGASIFGVSGDDLTFKTDSNAKKRTIKTDDIKSFVINYESGMRDSFIVSHSPLLTKSPVIRLLVDEQVKLYGLLYTYSNQYSYGAKEKYYYGTDANNIEQVTSLNFVAAMNQIMAGKPEIIEGIKASKYKVTHLDKLVDFYNLDADKNITWHKGHYYDTNGIINDGFFAKNIINGFVSGTEGKNLLFRKTLASETVKLKAGDIKAFAVTDSAQIDSFVVSHNTAFANAPFLKVINDQPLKFYGTSAELYNSKTIKKYYFGKTPEDITELTKKNFTATMNEAMADKIAIVHLVKKKTLSFDDMDAIMLYLKTGFWPEPATN